MSFRLRLVVAAAAIVLVSLVLSGGLSWLLVRSLEFQAAHDRLDRVVASDYGVVIPRRCVQPAANNPLLCANNRLVTQTEYVSRLRDLSQQLGGDRLLLLDHNRAVLFDSASVGTNPAAEIPVTRPHSVTNRTVFQADFSVDGVQYLGAAIAVPAAQRDPLGSFYLVLARNQGDIVTVAAVNLLERLALAGALALLIALLIVLLLSQALSRPLMELTAAADDIARGNYSRRVRIRSGGEIGVVGESFDKMAEAVERSRALQRRFLGDVSHELKTPLTSLLGFSQALVDGALPEEEDRRRAARIIHEEAGRVYRLSQELLDLARVEGGQMPIHAEAVDLVALLEQETESVKLRAAARDLTVEVRVPTDLPPVWADPERLHQILDNLLDNALKYAPAGTEVAVRAEVAAGMVDTMVENRAGEHRPDPERMFDRFYRADQARSSATAGVGLGLAISSELAALQGGRLRAHVDDEGRVRVILSLPAAAR